MVVGGTMDMSRPRNAAALIVSFSNRVWVGHLSSVTTLRKDLTQGVPTARRRFRLTEQWFVPKQRKRIGGELQMASAKFSWTLAVLEKTGFPHSYCQWRGKSWIYASTLIRYFLSAIRR
jgi:hypothetical protein